MDLEQFDIEVNERRLRQRLKQINLGLDSPEHRELCIVNEKWALVDILIPSIRRKASKRGWDSLVKRWRRQIHRILDIYGKYNMRVKLPVTENEQAVMEKDMRKLGKRWQQQKEMMQSRPYRLICKVYPNWRLFDPLMPDYREKRSNAEWDLAFKVWSEQIQAIASDCRSEAKDAAVHTTATTDS
jgi:hypothetical protein